jgi:putative hydrolase of the HAD superfamily
MPIKHLFFDLDRTLWDFDKNSFEELSFLYAKHRLHEKGISLSQEFIKIYKQINEKCWEQYRLNLLSKEDLRVKRFYDTFLYFGIENKSLSKQFGDDYVMNSPKRTSLISGTIDLLEKLYPRFKMHIITNGFEEVQHIKLSNSNLSKFFQVVVTSEMAGAKKPSPKVFEYALDKSGAKLGESIMIGDDLNTDIKGAIDMGMRAIYFNPHSTQHSYSVWKEVVSLSEINTILL